MSKNYLHILYMNILCFIESIKIHSNKIFYQIILDSRREYYFDFKMIREQNCMCLHYCAECEHEIKSFEYRTYIIGDNFKNNFINQTNCSFFSILCTVKYTSLLFFKY